MGYKLDAIKMLLKRAKPAFKQHIKKEKIDKKSIKYAQINNTKPTVVFENGLGVGMKYWDEVFLEIAKTNTVFAYNRKDDTILKNKTMSTQKIEELRVLLLKRGLKPPYVLVGHSLGGLYMQYYAKKYPDEVLGLVLVDSTHPNDFIDLSKFPKKIAKQFFYLSEYVHKFSQDLLELPNTEIPVIALVAEYKRLSLQREKMIPLIKIIKKIAQSYPILYPNCKLQWVDTGHMIMYDTPKIVIDSIKELLK